MKICRLCSGLIKKTNHLFLDIVGISHLIYYPRLAWSASARKSDKLLHQYEAYEKIVKQIRKEKKRMKTCPVCKGKKGFCTKDFAPWREPQIYFKCDCCKGKGTVIDWKENKTKS